MFLSSVLSLNWVRKYVYPTTENEMFLHSTIVSLRINFLWKHLNTAVKLAKI